MWAKPATSLRAFLAVVALGMGCVPSFPADDSACDARTLESGELRVRRVPCSAELISGGEGLTQDWLVENAQLRAVFRHAGSALTQLNAGGGTLLDLAAVGQEDVLGEALPLIGDGWLTDVAVHAVEEADVVGLDVVGAEGTVRWRLGADDSALSVDGLDALWVLPAADAERYGNVLSVDERVLAADGAAEDLGGVVRFDGVTKLSAGAPGVVYASVWSSDVSVEGTSDGERVELLIGEDLAGWLPVESGSFLGAVPQGVDGVRAVAEGHAPGSLESAGTGLDLTTGGLGALAVRVVDETGESVAAVVYARASASDDAYTAWPVPPQGATLPLGAGTYQLVVYGGPYREFWQASDFVVEGGVGLSVVLTGAYAPGDWVLADVRIPAWPDVSLRRSSAEAFAEAAAEEVAFGVCVATDEVCTASVSARWESRIAGRSGSIAVTQSVGEIISWEWNANSKRPAHGAVAWSGLSAEDALALSEGGPNQARLLVVDKEWVDAAGPAYAWSPHPDAVRLAAFADREGLAEVAAMGVDTWLGPLSWVSVADRAAFSAVDVERGIVAGNTVATNGPWVHLLVGDAGPGETTESTGSLEVSVEVSAPIWMGIDQVGLDVDGATVETWDLNEALDGTWTTQATLDLEFGVVQAWAIGAGASPEPLEGSRWAVTSPVWVGQPTGTSVIDTASQ